MTMTPDPSSVRAAVPEMVRRLMAILGPFAALLAAELARRPGMMAVFKPAWQRLMWVARRFAAVRLDATRRKSRAGELRAERETQRPRLPRGRGWLAQELGHNGRALAAQLAHLLDQPEMRAVIDAAPGFGRVLRPVCWMLGVARDKATSATELAAVKLDKNGAIVPRRPDIPRTRPGRMQPIRLIYPPVAPAPGIPPEIAWNFAKYR